MMANKTVILTVVNVAESIHVSWMQVAVKKQEMVTYITKERRPFLFSEVVQRYTSDDNVICWQTLLTKLHLVSSGGRPETGALINFFRALINFFFNNFLIIFLNNSKGADNVPEKLNFVCAEQAELSSSGTSSAPVESRRIFTSCKQLQIFRHHRTYKNYREHFWAW